MYTKYIYMIVMLPKPFYMHLLCAHETVTLNKCQHAVTNYHLQLSRNFTMSKHFK